MRAVVAVGAVLLGLLAPGCPREVDEPEIPPGVVRCEVAEDCNHAACGVLRACVGGLCEAADAGSLVIPCTDGGGAVPDAAP
ncbi:MAG: hypothetical protein ACODAU_02425 [Myxococcota bacterium]